MKIKDRKFAIVEHLLRAQFQTILTILEDENLKKKEIKAILVETTKTALSIMSELDSFIESDELDMVLEKGNWNIVDLINVVNMYVVEKIKLPDHVTKDPETKSDPTVINVTKETLNDLPQEVKDALKKVLGEIK